MGVKLKKVSFFSAPQLEALGYGYHFHWNHELAELGTCYELILNPV